MLRNRDPLMRVMQLVSKSLIVTDLCGSTVLQELTARVKALTDSFLKAKVLVFF